MSATRLLARGWYKGNAPWWRLSAATLAVALLALLIASGMFAGMQAETEQRVADFYVDEYRLSHGIALIPPDMIDPDVLDLYADSDAQLESQLVISRRGFLDQAINEDDQFGFQTPSGRDKDLALGALLGVPRNQPAIASHIVQGRMPQFTNGTAELVMSETRFRQFLTASEEAQFDRTGAFEISFSITAARLKGGSLYEGGELIRMQARVVGLFQTGVDVLDDFTYVATIQDTRKLQGYQPHDPVANVLLLDARPQDRHGLNGQTAEEFNHRYLGQMLAAIQFVATASAIALFFLPTVLVANGVLRQLQQQQREIAVTHAIGVPLRHVRNAIFVLLARMGGLGIVMTAGVLVVVGPILAVVLPKIDAAPVPLGFQLTLMSVAIAGLVLVVSIGLGALIAWRQSRMQNPAVQMRV